MHTDPTACTFRALMEMQTAVHFSTQACNLVPIVEPELLIDGDHSMERFAAASEQVISCCVKHLKQKAVCLEACLLKLQMIIPGVSCSSPRPTAQQIAKQTYDVMQR